MRRRFWIPTAALLALGSLTALILRARRKKG